MQKLLQRFIYGISFLFVIYQLTLPIYGFVPDLQERSLHLAFALCIIFATASATRSRARLIIDLGLLAVGAGACLYVLVHYTAIVGQYGIAANRLQVWLGLALLVVILEAARRTIRSVLPIIALCFLAYALWGHLIPGQFGHPQYRLSTVSSMFYVTTGGIWGQLVGVSSNVIAIFVCLGEFISATGGGTGFMRFAVQSAGRYKGGPAKVAVVASSLFGTVSGSASANVIITGVFTIPMMKRLKYPSAFAAAVEAVASTGGQLMPPIMGAGAFIMAEFLQTSYLSVAFHALLPALLFYLSVGVGIHFYALKHQYEGLSRAELPGWQATLKTSGFFLIPGAILLFWLIRGYTPQYAAFWAIISTLPFAFLTESWRPDFEHVFEKLETAALKGARQMAFIAIICASAQIIIAVTAFTGIGVKVSSVILGLSQNSLLLALLLTAFITILLGMEVPTTAAYTIAAVSCAAVLEGLHLPLLTAHMFIFYLAILSAITPPVCGAVFIAAGLADAPWFETAKYSLKLAFVAFLLPFLFVYDQSLLLVGSPLSITLAIGRSILAVVALSAGLMGYWGKAVCSRFGQGILFGAGVLLIIPRLWTDIAGIAIIALYSLYVYRLQTRP